MKFDKIIMNPPYSGNLHLKIVEACISHLSKDGNLVNLSPIRWLQNPLAEYKKTSDWNTYKDIRTHISTLDIIPQEAASEIFQALVHGDLGVYVINDKGGFTIDNKYKSIIEKILNKGNHWSDVVEQNKVNGIRVKTQAVRNSAPSSSHTIKSWKKDEACYHLMYKNYSCIFIDGKQDGKWWTEFGNKNAYTKSVGTPLIDSIPFKSVEEAQYFEKSCWTKFMLFCNKISKVGVHTNFEFLPFMPTYTHEWTDKMFYEYYDFTEDEINIIEETI